MSRDNRYLFLAILALALLAVPGIEHMSDRWLQRDNAAAVELTLERGVLVFQATQQDSQPSPQDPLKLASAGVSQFFFSPISINHADKELLMTLPGVGPKMAERIILYRSENGPLASSHELTNIRGIGEKKAARLKKLIVIL